jgi:hypothetical protein
MADMLEWGEKYLREKRAEFMSKDVVYIMSEGVTFHVKAAVGQHFYRSTSVDAFTTLTRSVDFIIDKDALQREPKDGDMVIYNGQRYSVGAPNGETVWEWSGFEQKAYRVHTFCKGDDTLNRVVINTEV